MFGNPVRFWDLMAARYARTPVADEVSYQKKLAMTAELLTPESLVFEFGCGTGSTAIVHAPSVRKITAIDVSKNMLEIARSKAADQGVENIQFERSAIEDYAGQDNTYDVVLGLSILHLLADRNNAIARVYSLLKPGGAFVSSTVCVAETMNYLKPVLAVVGALPFLPLVKVFGEQDLIDSLHQAGFEIEQQWRQGNGKAVFIVARKPAS